MKVGLPANTGAACAVADVMPLAKPSGDERWFARAESTDGKVLGLWHRKRDVVTGSYRPTTSNSAAVEHISRASGGASRPQLVVGDRVPCCENCTTFYWQLSVAFGNDVTVRS